MAAIFMWKADKPTVRIIIEFALITPFFKRESKTTVTKYYCMIFSESPAK